MYKLGVTFSFVMVNICSSYYILHQCIIDDLLVTCTFSKWTVAEIDLLHSAVKSFGNDLNKIAEKMKSRTVYVLMFVLRCMHYLQ